MDKTKTGQLIKDARVRSGLTQAELGDMIGVTNKAVSRWEKGESFPDVGVLESLSDALHIEIEDIVTGGEKEEDVSKTLTDLVNTVKLQKRVNRRWTVISIAAAGFGLLSVYLGIVIFKGYTSFVEGAATSVLASMMIFLLIYSATTSSVTAAKSTKTDIIMIAVPIITALYATVMLALCVNDAINGKLSFGLSAEKTGPFLNNQFAAIFTINFALAAVLMVHGIRNRESVRFAIILSTGAFMLALVYSDFLHNMATLEGTMQAVFSRTGQVYFTVIIAAFTKWGIERHKRG